MAGDPGGKEIGGEEIDMPHDLSAFKDAVGASSPVAIELVTAGPVARLAATFGIDTPASKPGDVLPPGWADLYFGSLHRPNNMRADGQAAKSSWMPAIPFSVTRIGGDRTEFLGDVRIGDELKRVTAIKDVAASPSGDSLRIVQRTQTTGPRGLAIVEEREFVHFDGHGPAAPPSPKMPEAVWKKPLDPSPVLLFRYSALRFNSHRIHYDRRYAMEVEGAPGLIVQSSLLGQLLIELCREHAPQKRLTAIARINRQVVHDTGPILVCGAPRTDGKSAVVWVLDQEGQPALHGEASFA
jgi:3-methylfumaryl-CoA hydratase